MVVKSLQCRPSSQYYKKITAVIYKFFEISRVFIPGRCSSLGQAPGLTHKHQTRLERLARDKHSSLLQKSVNYGSNFFIVQAPVGFCYLLCKLKTVIFDHGCLILAMPLLLMNCLLLKPRLIYMSDKKGCFRSPGACLIKLIMAVIDFVAL